MRDLSTLAQAAYQAERTLCKCCGNLAPKAGSVDFNQCCVRKPAAPLPAIGISVAYHRCQTCGFLFSRFFDHWTTEELGSHVYNHEYTLVDPDFTGLRPNNFADTLLDTFSAQREAINFLDWGAGAGILAHRLREGGFGRAEAYDPFVPGSGEPPQGPFNMMGCFEVLEHVIDPVASLRRIVEFLAPDGFLMISTLVQGEAFVAQGLDWWYVAPRNGHVSIHSPQSLNRLWNGAGFRLTTLSQNTHVAWRRVPPFAAHLPHFFRG